MTLAASRKVGKALVEGGHMYDVVVKASEFRRAAFGATLKCSLSHSALLEKEQQR